MEADDPAVFRPSKRQRRCPSDLPIPISNGQLLDPTDLPDQSCSNGVIPTPKRETSPRGRSNVERLPSAPREAGDRLEQLSHEINKRLRIQVPNDTIDACGPAPLSIIATDPGNVLELAQEKLHTWPYRSVPSCWRRLYEDASLHRAAELLRSQAEQDAMRNDVSKIQKTMNGDPWLHSADPDWLTEVVGVLDMGVALSGMPGRQDLFGDIFQRLEDSVGSESPSEAPGSLSMLRPPPLETDCHILSAVALTFEDFQDHLHRSRSPLVLNGIIDHWPAMARWHDPTHLLRLTLGGRRLVPIEIGSSYTDEAWGQQIVTFGDYMQKYILPDEPDEIGYLAQHDLLTQIPKLRNDICVPDYCYTTPPAADASISRSGLQSAKQLDEPMLNAWFGPRGTRSPLHTDPYHNIFCQVVGYKYVRLYAPEETPDLYPRGVDESGVNMENTSEIDFAFARRHGESVIESSFPKFRRAKYQEAILGPGQCLYIPVGWWHFVESLSTSFSVSFWWN